VTLVCVLFYAVSQQVYRQDLNDPQIQMAEDAAARLGQGAVSAEIVPHGTPLVDLGNSLAPWIAVYDSNGQILEASGQLDNAPPALPKGVFDTSQWLAHPNGLYYNQSPIAQNRFTWQPQPDVRQAVVLTQTKDKKYFVASGRNMREVEQRIEHEGEVVGVGWLGTLGAVLVVELAYAFFVRRVAGSSSRRG
jgi:hypothetical protein